MWLFATPILAFLTSLSMLILFAVAIAMMIGLVYLAFYLYLSLHRLRNLSVSESLQQQHEQLKLLKLHYQIEQEAAKAQQQQVKVRLEEAKLMRTVQQVIKPGHRLVLGGPDGIQLLDGAPQIATTRPTAPNVIKSHDNDQLAFATGEQWINDFLFDANGKLRIHHVSVNGPTRSGKTWLLLNFIHRMQQPHPEADYFLIDPKYEGPSSGWPFQPFVTDFDEVPEAMNYIYNNVVKVRRAALQADKPIPYPAFVCIDEFDGCSAEHGRDFLKPVSRGVKEGASGGTHYMAVGQSTLIGDIGGNGALYRNMGRVIFGTEGLAFLNNSQFVYRGMKAEKRIWERQLYYLQQHGRRYALIVPPSSNGLPFVAEIPDLQKPLFRQRQNTESKSSDLPADKSATESKSLDLPADKSKDLDSALDSTLRSDLATVRAHADRLRYDAKTGAVMSRSVQEILQVNRNSAQYDRVLAVVAVLNERTTDGAN
jgi:hypothetical protein